MTPGLIALLAALVVALAGGVIWRLTNGRMRIIPVQARADPGELSQAAGADAGGNVVSAAAIGRPLGERATLLQFSSAFCAPCRATRQILAEVAGLTSGVAHIEIDAESRLDLVRELGVVRTPTVLVLDGGGRVTRRASGRPTKADVLAALGATVGNG